MKFILILLTVFFATYGLSQNSPKKSSVKKQLKDFSIFKEAILSNTAGLYYYNSEKEFADRLDSLEKVLHEPKTEIELYKLYAKCVASIRCGHTIIMVKEIYADYLKNKSTLPFDVYYVNGKLLVKNDYSNGSTIIPKYTEILSINNEKISNIAADLSQYISSDGYNQTHKNERMKFKFMFYYYCFKDQTKKFEIKYVGNNNDTLTAYFDAVIPKKEPRVKESDYYKQLERHIDTLQNRALLVLPNPLPRNNTYKLQLDTFFVYLQNYSVDNLIIDLRGNTGGLSQFYITGYLCDSSYTYEYRTLQGKKKPSHHYQKPFDSQRISIFCTRIATLNGKTTTVKESKPHYPQFKGNLYILTDGWTFSAAANLTSILKEYSGAVTVGEETGGSYHRCSSGNLILKLPHSKLLIKINPMKYVNSVEVTENKGGVLPTYEVKPSDKWDEVDDVQLKFVYDLINKRK